MVIQLGTALLSMALQNIAQMHYTMGSLKIIIQYYRSCERDIWPSVLSRHTEFHDNLISMLTDMTGDQND